MENFGPDNPHSEVQEIPDIRFSYGREKRPPDAPLLTDALDFLLLAGMGKAKAVISRGISSAFGQHPCCFSYSLKVRVQCAYHASRE